MHTSIFPTYVPEARQNRSQSIVQELHRRIASGALQPGDRLPTENSLCTEFRVSRTTLREAIQMLRVFGLLDISPGRGSFVTQPSPVQLVEQLSRIFNLLPCDDAALIQLLGQLLIASAHHMPQQPVAQRREVFDFILTRQMDARTAAQTEAHWLAALSGLYGNPLQDILVQALLQTLASQRELALQEPDEILRSVQLQIRASTALLEQQPEILVRTLQAYLLGFVGITQQQAA